MEISRNGINHNTPEGPGEQLVPSIVVTKLTSNKRTKFSVTNIKRTKPSEHGKRKQQCITSEHLVKQYLESLIGIIGTQHSP